MHIQMNLDGVEVITTAEKRTENSNRPTLRTLISGALSLGLGLVVAIVGFMMGLTLMLIMLGLMPIALLWFWYVTRQTATSTSTVTASVASTTQEHDANVHATSSDTGVPGHTSTGPQAPTSGNEGTHP